MDPTETVRRYYEALDEHEYASLADLLAADVRHERPDRTIEGRERFVRFMREGRPQTDTSHPIEAVWPTAVDGGGRAGTRVAVQGRLLDADGDEITGFVDVFTLVDGEIRLIETYTD